MLPEDQPKIENAKITSTTLGTEDHGIFSCMIYLEGESSSQGFGGYALDEYSEGKNKRIGNGYGIDFIKGILEVAGATNWEDLKGKYVRVKRDGKWNSNILAIGHLIEDKWFDPKEVYDSAKRIEED